MRSLHIINSSNWFVDMKKVLYKVVTLVAKKVLVQVCDVVIFGTKQRVRKQLDSSLLRAVLKKLQLPTSLPPIQDKVQTLLVFAIGSWTDWKHSTWERHRYYTNNLQWELSQLCPLAAKQYRNLNPCWLHQEFPRSLLSKHWYKVQA